jgi:DNA-binding transcriptional MerR regulator
VFPARYELRSYTAEDGILHSHRGENLKPAGFSSGEVRHELRFYTADDGILHSHRSENLKYYTEDDV